MAGLANLRAQIATPSLDVRAHEIVGVAGVSGNGQKDLLEVLGGQRPGGGAVAVGGAPYIATRRQSQVLHRGYA